MREKHGIQQNIVIPSPILTHFDELGSNISTLIRKRELHNRIIASAIFDLGDWVFSHRIKPCKDQIELNIKDLGTYVAKRTHGEIRSVKIERHFHQVLQWAGYFDGEAEHGETNKSLLDSYRALCKSIPNHIFNALANERNCQNTDGKSSKYPDLNDDTLTPLFTKPKLAEIIGIHPSLFSEAKKTSRWYKIFKKHCIEDQKIPNRYYTTYSDLHRMARSVGKNIYNNYTELADEIKRKTGAYART